MIAGSRVLVHESVAEEFVRHLVGQVETFVVGEPTAGEDEGIPAAVG